MKKIMHTIFYIVYIWLDFTKTLKISSKEIVFICFIKLKHQIFGYTVTDSKHYFFQLFNNDTYFILSTNHIMYPSREHTLLMSIVYLKII